MEVVGVPLSRPFFALFLLCKMYLLLLKNLMTRRELFDIIIKIGKGVRS